MGGVGGSRNPHPSPAHTGAWDGEWVLCLPVCHLTWLCALVRSCELCVPPHTSPLSEVINGVSTEVSTPELSNHFCDPSAMVGLL